LSITLILGCGLLDGADIYKPGCLTKIEHNLDENLTKIAGKTKID
jgi:hypothetical protein